MKNPPKELEFLNEIPKDLIDLENTRDTELEEEEVEKLDKWLEENPKSTTYK